MCWRWWEQWGWRSRSECLCWSLELGWPEEQTKDVMRHPWARDCFPSSTGDSESPPFHGAWGRKGLLTASGWRAWLHEMSQSMDPWEPNNFNLLELGEVYCTPRAPKPWGLWLNSVHFVWNLLKEKVIWEKFRNFWNSRNCKCWPTVRNSQTIEASAILTTFSFVSIIPPIAWGYTSYITHTLSSFQWETEDQLSCHYLHIPLW